MQTKARKKTTATARKKTTTKRSTSGPRGASNTVYTNRSGSLAAGATSQVLAAENRERRYLFIQNISDETMWINFGVAAVQDQPSVQLTAGASLTIDGGVISTQAVNIIGTTAGKKFVAKEA